MEAKPAEPKAAPKSWLLIWLNRALLGFLLLCGVVAWIYHANSQVPPFVPPPVTLPTPNAYDIYRQAIDLLPFGRWQNFDNLLHQINDPETPETERPRILARIRAQQVFDKLHSSKTPASERPALLTLMREMLPQNAETLRLVRSGLPHDFLAPPIYSLTVGGINHTYYREIAYLFWIEGAVAEADGRYADAADSYLDCIEFGQDLARGGTLIAKFISIACEDIGMGPLYGVVDKLDAKAAARVARRLEQLEKTGVPLWETIDHERLAMIAGITNLVQTGRIHQLTDPPPWAPAPKPAGLEEWLKSTYDKGTTPWEIAVANKTEAIRHIDKFHQTWIAESKQPWCRLKPVAKPDDPISHLIDPDYQKCVFIVDRNDALFRLLEVKAALRAFRLEKDRLPEALPELVPSYLGRIPDDPFTGDPLRYKKEGETYRLYSVGPDGVDDNGEVCGIHAKDHAGWGARSMTPDCPGDVPAEWKGE